jgi:hypothetical protein
VAPVGWWRAAAWERFKVELPEWMKQQMEHWRGEAVSVNADERKVRQELEQMVSEPLPIGVGALSWITLKLEIRGSRALRESPRDRQLYRVVSWDSQQQWPWTGRQY